MEFSKVVNIQPKQLELLHLILYSPKTKICFGGANGGGKSAAIRLCNIALCTRVKKQPIRTLIFRRKSNDLLENHIIPFFQQFPNVEKYFNKTERMIYWPDGSTTKFGASDAEKDITDYEGKEYEYIFIDEATHCTQYMIEYLTSRNRSGYYKAKMIFTTIPGGIGHNYIKRLFVKKKYEENENPDEYYYLPARVWDNVVWCERALEEQGYSPKEYYYEWNDDRRKEFTLQYSDYARNLSHLKETQKRARLFGDWDVIEGNFFDTWDSQVHIVKPKDYLLYSQLLEWSVGAGLDYGNTTVMEWMARDFNGNYILFDELYQYKMSRSKKIEQTLEFVNHRGLPEKLIVADTNMWIKDAFDVDNTTMPAQDYIKAGIRLIPVSKSTQNKNRSYRENCNDNVKDVLDFEMDDTGKITKPPKLLVYERCGNFIENFPVLMTDPNNEDDIADGQEDHCFIGDTLIATNRGYRKIKNIKVGDKVLTRKGFKKVAIVHKQDNKTVYDYTQLNLTATPNHPVIVGDKIKSIHDLTQADILCRLQEKEYLKCLNTENQKQLKLMGSISGVIPNQKLRTTETITDVAKIILRTVLDTCTFISGNNTTKGKSRRAITFITRMKTRITMILAILNVRSHSIIFQITQKLGLRKIKSELSNIWITSDRLLLNGTGQKKLRLFIAMLLKKDGRIIQRLNVFVRFVGRNMNPLSQLLFSVPQNVTRNGKETTQRKMLRENVNGVAKHFTSQNFIKKSHTVQEVAQSNIPVQKRNGKTVYNLTVEDCHEYYANGILVHNCYDAAKYILMYLRQPYQKVDEQAYLRSLNRPTAYTGKAKTGKLNDKSLRM